MTDIAFLAVTIASAAIVAAVVLAILLWRSHKQAPAEDPVLAQLTRAQAEAAARLEGAIRLLANNQSQLQRSVNDRLDSVSHRLGDSLEKTKQSTADNLQKLGERLAVIDRAQKNITDLATQVTSLQGVLANKQSRGAFGQWRMEAIVQDCLPKGAYAFQYTLGNRTRPDCCVFLPDKRPLVIDAKFPLEGFTAYREAKSDDERKAAAQRLRGDVGKHVADIAEKYLIPGETQEMAFMFVPSESIYAELYDGFDDLVQKAYRARVVVVSPSLLMLAIQVVQQIQKDARMREAASQIRDEVGRLVRDVSLLGDRVRKLQTHFNQSNEDIRQAVISIDKIEAHGERIQQVELGAEMAAAPSPTNSNVIPGPVRKLEAGE
jgi:DNA recombination protein RmuC